MRQTFAETFDEPDTPRQDTSEVDEDEYLWLPDNRGDWPDRNTTLRLLVTRAAAREFADALEVEIAPFPILVVTENGPATYMKQRWNV